MTIYSYCLFMYDYPDRDFFLLFPQLQGKCQGKTPQRRGTAGTLSNFCVVLCIFFVLCCFLYYLCVYVYCTTATGWLPNCS